jgi:membrane-associated phospholipid phosphatase
MSIIKKIPKYAIIPTIALMLLQISIYYGSQFITRDLKAYDLTIQAFDNLVPIVTPFIVFYILSYPWWYLSPLIVALTNKQRFFNWILSLIICYVICFIIYIVWPTTITRPIIDNNNIFDWLTNFIYLNDSPERPINLFPSFHCLISWFCYIGVRKQKNIPLWYRLGALIFAILICFSTQFIKQHYIIDLIGAIFLAELVFYIVNKINLGKLLKKEKEN